MSKSERLRVLLIDDHPLVLTALDVLVRKIDPAANISQAATCEEALKLRSTTFDLVVLEHSSNGPNGLGAIKVAREAFPMSRLTVISVEDSQSMVKAAFDAGVVGYVLKSSSRETIIEAFHAILSGVVYAPTMATGDPVPADLVAKWLVEQDIQELQLDEQKLRARFLPPHQPPRLDPGDPVEEPLPPGPKNNRPPDGAQVALPEQSDRRRQILRQPLLGLPGKTFTDKL